MVNTMKLLLKKKIFIIMGIVAPAVIIVFFSFAFGSDMNYKVGIINKDNNYISNEVVEAINKVENIDVVDISKENYEMLIISHQIQMVVIIEENFSDNILNLEESEVTIKSISNSDVKETLVSIIKSKVNNLSLIAKISGKNIDKFKKNNEDYKENLLNYTLSEVENVRPAIENSIGIVIMMILISGASIANFLIEDEENNTKKRVLVSGIKPYKYYMSLLIVFYLVSAITSIIYYELCKMLNLDFGMSNTNNFLIVMLVLNLVSIALNLCIVSFTKNRYIASTVNILIVIPTCMLSGVFWDFEIMPDYLQKIGSLMPQRWVYKCIENLQIYDSFNYIYQYVFYMIGLALILFSLSLFMFKVKK